MAAPCARFQLVRGPVRKAAGVRPFNGIVRRHGVDTVNAHHLVHSSILCALVVTGCAASSGVSKTGPNTYTLTTSASPGRGGVPAAKGAAYQEASAECTRQQRQFILINEKLSPPTWTEGMAIATLEFRCE